MGCDGFRSSEFALSTEFRILRWLLLLSGSFLMCALLAMLLPVGTMQAAHQWLGLGEFPVAPITIYLARSTSLLYAVHGSIMFYTGLTIQNHWRFIPLLGWLHILIGMAIFVIDITSPMPTYWIAMEGGPIAALGVLMLVLFRKGSLADAAIPTEQNSPANA